MALAKVNYIAGLSYERGGRKFVKGQPQTLTDVAEIAHYKATAGFVVTMLNEPKKEKAAAPPAPEPKKAVRTKVPTPEPDEEPDQDGDEDEDADDGEEDDDDSAEV